MNTLVSYLKNHLDELVDDAVSSLRLGDASFVHIEANRLREALRDVTWHLVLFAEERAPHHLETCCRAFVSLWEGEPGRPSDAIEFFWQLEDLAVLRVVPAPGAEEDHFEEIRVLRSLNRQVMGAVADRLVDDGRAGSVNSPQKPLTVDLSLTMDESLRGGANSTALGVARAAASGIALMESHSRSRFVGRKEELRTIWARLRAVTGEGKGHQIIGLRGAP